MQIAKRLWIVLLLSLVLGPGIDRAAAQEPQPPTEGRRPVYQNDVLGVAVQTLPPQTRVVEDQYLSDAFGFTVVDPQGRMVLRLAWRHRDRPDQIGQRVRELIGGFPGVDLRPQPIRISAHQGVMVPDAPGMDPSTYIYVTANGRLYEVICPQQEGSVACGELLNQLIFGPASRTLEELRLIRAEDALYEKPPAQEIPLPKGPAEVDAPMGKGPRPGGDEVFSIEPLAAPGCADWPTWKFLQSPWSSTANGPGTPWPQGWSQAGPSYYGEGLHRYCNRTSGLNDYHALDFPLKEWDVVYPPASGTVLYAGWAGGGWAGLGRVVIVDLGNGYSGMAAHLRSINVSAGQGVGISTVIGYAGRSGNFQDNYWPSNHLHQGLYLNASLNPTYGSIYGGQSVEPHHVRYFGNGGGYYETIGRYQWMSW